MQRLAAAHFMVGLISEHTQPTNLTLCSIEHLTYVDDHDDDDDETESEIIRALS